MSDRKNKECFRCHGKFHACSSCGLYYDWEQQYCSRACYMMSDERGGLLWAIATVAGRFRNDEEGRELLCRLLDNPETHDLLYDELKKVGRAEECDVTN